MNAPFRIGPEGWRERVASLIDWTVGRVARVRPDVDPETWSLVPYGLPGAPCVFIADVRAALRTAEEVDRLDERVQELAREHREDADAWRDMLERELTTAGVDLEDFDQDIAEIECYAAAIHTLVQRRDQAIALLAEPAP